MDNISDNGVDLPLGVSQFEDGGITVSLPIDDLLGLVEDSNFLKVLMDNGVDKWEGWEDSRKKYKEFTDLGNPFVEGRIN